MRPLLDDPPRFPLDLFAGGAFLFLPLSLIVPLFALAAHFCAVVGLLLVVAALPGPAFPFFADFEGFFGGGLLQQGDLLFGLSNCRSWALTDRSLRSS